MVHRIVKTALGGLLVVSLFLLAGACRQALVPDSKTHVITLAADDFTVTPVLGATTVLAAAEYAVEAITAADLENALIKFNLQFASSNTWNEVPFSLHARVTESRSASVQLTVVTSAGSVRVVVLGDITADEMDFALRNVFGGAKIRVRVLPTE